IIHEALLQEWGVLKRRLEDDRQFLVWRQKLEPRIREWLEPAPDSMAQRDEGKLLRGRDLAEVLAWRARHEDEVKLEEREFLDASRASQAYEQAIEQAAVEWQRRAAHSASRQLAAEAISLWQQDRDLALLLSVEAHRKANTVEARKGLLHALGGLPVVLSF